MAHTRSPRFEPCMTVPVLALKCLRQSRQRYGCGLRLSTSWMSTLPQCGQATPFGQRVWTNQASAVLLSGNMLVISSSVIPFR